MVAAIIRVIVTAMVASGMTPQEIADKARVPVNTVYRMRKGYLIRLDKFGRICEALDIKPEDVIDYQRLEQRSHGKDGSA